MAPLKLALKLYPSVIFYANTNTDYSYWWTVKQGKTSRKNSEAV